MNEWILKQVLYAINQCCPFTSARGGQLFELVGPVGRLKFFGTVTLTVFARHFTKWYSEIFVAVQAILFKVCFSVLVAI